MTLLWTEHIRHVRLPSLLRMASRVVADYTHTRLAPYSFDGLTLDSPEAAMVVEGRGGFEAPWEYRAVRVLAPFEGQSADRLYWLVVGAAGEVGRVYWRPEEDAWSYSVGRVPPPRAEAPALTPAGRLSRSVGSF